MERYKNWCVIKGYQPKNRNIVKKELIKLNIKVEISKGVNVDGISGKRGYNITLL